MALDLVEAGLHVVKGTAYAALGYVGGSFMGAVSTSIGFTQLGNLPLGLMVGTLTFVGYAVDKVIALHKGQ